MTEKADVVIRSRRGRLFVQAAAISAVGIAAGLFLQSWSVIRSSPLGRISDIAQFPVIAIVVALVAIWGGVTLAYDKWNTRVVLGQNSMTIRDAHGTFTVPYGNVDSAGEVPLGGVGIAFRDPDQWIGGLTTAADLRARTAAVLRHAHGADYLLPSATLHVGTKAFLELLTARIDTDKGGA
jgi:hypothetical protein